MHQSSLLCLPQLTVVVKCFFQFGFFPWTTSAYRGINADRPFALPNIIGVEKKDGYVLFDFIQLLALFFHRSILKVTSSKMNTENHPVVQICPPAPVRLIQEQRFSRVKNLYLSLCSVMGCGTTRRWRCLTSSRR